MSILRGLRSPSVELSAARRVALLRPLQALTSGAPASLSATLVVVEADLWLQLRYCFLAASVRLPPPLHPCSCGFLLLEGLQFVCILACPHNVGEVGELLFHEVSYWSC